IWLFHLEIRDISTLVLDLDTVGALQFQIGGAKHRMSWREFILVMGLHTTEEMESARFGTYWAESARLITCNITGRSQAPEKEICFRKEAQGDDIWGQFVARLAEHFGL
ncbi:hypothetical protein Tco_1198093, partial [Tanacetum coccineum]